MFFLFFIFFVCYNTVIGGDFIHKNIKKLLLKFNIAIFWYIYKLKKLKNKKNEGYTFVKKLVLKINNKLKVQFNVIGLENIPHNSNYTIFCNHRGLYDPMAVITFIDDNLAFAMKQSLSENPLTGSIAAATGSKFLMRNPKDDLKVIIEMIDEAKNGQNFLIFPEGTRNEADELLEFKAGAFKVPQKSGCDILPVAISGSEYIFDKKGKQQEIVISFLPIIKYDSFKDIKTSQLSKQVREIIQKEYKKISS